MIKVLAIGNSFSEDATHYLHQIAKADGVDMKVVNLYIGGCSLKQHWENIQSEAKAYLLQENGYSTEQYVSIQEALAMEDWDYVVTQQVSHESGMLETYSPYIENMQNYVREIVPKAEFLLQQTWAYEMDSLHSGFWNYHQNQQEMYKCLKEAYQTVASKLGVRLIPCGDVIQDLRGKEPFLYNRGGMSLCRDGFHMNAIYGRYALAATWYKTIACKSMQENSYIPCTDLLPEFDCNTAILEVVKEAVDVGFSSEEK